MAHNMLLKNNSEEFRPCWYCVIKNSPHRSDFSVSEADIHYQFLDAFTQFAKSAVSRVVVVLPHVSA